MKCFVVRFEMNQLAIAFGAGVLQGVALASHELRVDVEGFEAKVTTGNMPANVLPFGTISGDAYSDRQAYAAWSNQDLKESRLAMLRSQGGACDAINSALRDAIAYVEAFSRVLIATPPGNLEFDAVVGDAVAAGEQLLARLRDAAGLFRPLPATSPPAAVEPEAAKLPEPVAEPEAVEWPDDDRPADDGTPAG